MARLYENQEALQNLEGNLPTYLMARSIARRRLIPSVSNIGLEDVRNLHSVTLISSKEGMDLKEIADTRGYNRYTRMQQIHEDAIDT